ncbi:Uncharacterized protein FWK35_00009643 [Aphis craccivora]|uniref:Uncharacterized protein n=1 Tax=Aphis craccivora TaxID=307492 RepID=A0A6G0ZA90_APHCR|nr:Uncharacterized protein FWK35_00009643 [Aphis craccivora]
MKKLSIILNELMGSFRWQKEKSNKLPVVFKKFRKNNKKVTEKQEFSCKTSYRQKRFFYGCNSKTNHYI